MKKCKQSDHYVYASQKDVAELKERVAALEKLLKPKEKNDDNQNNKGPVKSEQGSGESKSVFKNQGGANQATANQGGGK